MPAKPKKSMQQRHEVKKPDVYLTFLIVQFLGQLNTAIISVSEMVVVFSTRHTES
jgi:hypothetical protein